MAAVELISVDVSEESVGTEGLVTLYRVEIRNNTGQWIEEFGSAESVRTFLKGVKVGAVMSGAPTPQIPDISVKFPV